MLSKFVLLTFSAGFLLSLSSQAQAQTQSSTSPFGFGGNQEEQTQAEAPKAFNPYDKKYRPRPQPEGSSKTNMIGESDLAPQIIRLSGMPSDHFALRLVASKAVTGCLKKEDQNVKIEKNNGVMKVILGGGEISTDRSSVSYSQYECDLRTGTSIIDIPITRSDLLAADIKTLMVQNESSFTIVKLELDIQDDKITFSEDVGLSKPKKKSANAPLVFERTFWLYPEGTKVLHTNAKNKSEDVMSMMRTLARSKGLTPLEEIMPGFSAPNPASGKIYVVDTQGQFKDAAPLLGEIDIPEPFFGPQGQYERLTKKQVFMQDPGLYE